MSYFELKNELNLAFDKINSEHTFLFFDNFFECLSYLSIGVYFIFSFLTFYRIFSKKYKIDFPFLLLTTVILFFSYWGYYIFNYYSNEQIYKLNDEYNKNKMVKIANNNDYLNWENTTLINYLNQLPKSSTEDFTINKNGSKYDIIFSIGDHKHTFTTDNVVFKGNRDIAYFKVLDENYTYKYKKGTVYLQKIVLNKNHVYSELKY